MTTSHNGTSGGQSISQINLTFWLFYVKSNIKTIKIHLQTKDVQDQLIAKK